MGWIPDDGCYRGTIVGDLGALALGRSMHVPKPPDKDIAAHRRSVSNAVTHFALSRGCKFRVRTNTRTGSILITRRS